MDWKRKIVSISTFFSDNKITKNNKNLIITLPKKQQREKKVTIVSYFESKTGKNLTF